MLNLFRVVSMTEGVSFLILLFIAMPLKHHFGYPLAVTIMGWTHGLLYMAYLYLGMNAGQRQRWSGAFVSLVAVLGAIPFGCFYLERRLRRELATESAAR